MIKINDKIRFEDSSTTLIVISYDDNSVSMRVEGDEFDVRVIQRDQFDTRNFDIL